MTRPSIPSRGYKRLKPLIELAQAEGRQRTPEAHQTRTAADLHQLDIQRPSRHPQCPGTPAAGNSRRRGA